VTLFKIKVELFDRAFEIFFLPFLVFTMLKNVFY